MTVVRGQLMRRLRNPESVKTTTRKGDQIPTARDMWGPRFLFSFGDTSGPNSFEVVLRPGDKAVLVVRRVYISPYDVAGVIDAERDRI
jgi:hypothetical protein